MLTLINLDAAVARRELMAEQLDTLGVTYERVGVDLRKVSDAAIDAWLARHLPGIGFDRAELSGAEIGCWCSHLMAWKRLAASVDHAATVIEDDLLLSANFGEAINVLAQNSPFDVVFLGTSSRNISTRKRTSIDGVHVHAPVGAIFNTWGYMIARHYVVQFFAQPRSLAVPIDHWLGDRCRTLKPTIAVVRPALVEEDRASGLDSQIEPHTMRIDRWKIVEHTRRAMLASRVSDFYYALYRFL